MTSTETYGIGAGVDSVYNELNQLEKRYGEYLEQESLTGDVMSLKNAIEDYKQGSLKATEYLQDHGMEVIRQIKEKLEAATAEQHRILEESPTASDSTGKKAHRISRAAAIAMDAESKLESSLENELQH